MELVNLRYKRHFYIICYKNDKNLRIIAMLCLVTSVVSISVRPLRRQTTRLPRAWYSPGKITEVGCHFLLQCMKVKSESEVAQSCLTLWDPMDCSPPGSSIHGIFQARVLEWVAMAAVIIRISQLYLYATTCILKIFSPLLFFCWVLAADQMLAL